MRAGGSRGLLRQGSGQALHSADSGRDDTKKEKRGTSSGLSADASKMMRRLLRKGDASARARNPGSFDSADSAQDDTKKDSGRDDTKRTSLVTQRRRA